MKIHIFNRINTVKKLMIDDAPHKHFSILFFYVLILILGSIFHDGLWVNLQVHQVMVLCQK
jgi:hypothetical protein